MEYDPDLDKIMASQVPIAVGHGAATGDPLALRMTQTVAAQLGIECREFPGGHAAPLEVPVKFAAALRPLLDRL